MARPVSRPARRALLAAGQDVACLPDPTCESGDDDGPSPPYLDPATPPEVVVTDTLRPRVGDPTLGVPLGAAGPGLPAVPDRPTHRLVTLGDSLTHGMSSGAVFRTDLSWPALVAQSLGTPFVVSRYGGPLDGLPLTLERLHELHQAFGTSLDVLEVVRAPLTLQRLVDANEDYWERGPGSRPPRLDLHYENLRIYGWDVRDSLSWTAARSRARIAGHPARDDLLGAEPEHDNDLAAVSSSPRSGRPRHRSTRPSRTAGTAEPRPTSPPSTPSASPGCERFRRGGCSRRRSST